MSRSLLDICSKTGFARHDIFLNTKLPTSGTAFQDMHKIKSVHPSMGGGFLPIDEELLVKDG